MTTRFRLPRRRPDDLTADEVAERHIENDRQDTETEQVQAESTEDRK